MYIISGERARQEFLRANGGLGVLSPSRRDNSLSGLHLQPHAPVRRNRCAATTVDMLALGHDSNLLQVGLGAIAAYKLPRRRNPLLYLMVDTDTVHMRTLTHLHFPPHPGRGWAGANRCLSLGAFATSPASPFRGGPRSCHSEHAIRSFRAPRGIYVFRCKILRIAQDHCFLSHIHFSTTCRLTSFAR
jgi:hypothetical protein